MEVLVKSGLPVNAPLIKEIQAYINNFERKMRHDSTIKYFSERAQAVGIGLPEMDKITRLIPEGLRRRTT